MENLTGIYGFLYNCPTWAIATGLYFICIGILFILRDWYEKLPYNISVASQQGDLALIGYILIGAEVLKRQTQLPNWTTSFIFDLPAVAMSIIIVGMFYHYGIISKQHEKQTVADIYHNIIIVPLLIALIVLMLPIIWLYGTIFEKTFSTCCLLIWPTTIYFDRKQGRLQQTKWLLEKGLPRFYGKNGYRISIFPLVQGTPKKY